MKAKTFNKATGSVLLVISLAVSATVFAASDVRFTVHNLSNNNDATKGLPTSGANARSFYSSNVDQVCIFCHTPHNASPASPLWNKASLPGTTPSDFRLYTSSKTLTPTTKGASLKANSPSLLCLSCHDGKTAINVLHNSSTGTDAGPTYPGDKLVNAGTTSGQLRSIQFFAESFGYLSPANIGGTEGDEVSRKQGGNLTDDHPIGFNYANAYNTDAASKAALRDPTIIAASTPRVRFFNGEMECSTCHDPHVRYFDNTPLRPFLVMSNTGSALCLACHNK